MYQIFYFTENICFQEFLRIFLSNSCEGFEGTAVVLSVKGGRCRKGFESMAVQGAEETVSTKKKTSGQEVNVLSFVPQCCRRMLLDCGCGRFPSRHVDQSWECVFFHMSQEKKKKKKALQIM